jgi:hypothetical protein
LAGHRNAGQAWVEMSSCPRDKVANPIEAGTSLHRFGVEESPVRRELTL